MSEQQSAPAKTGPQDHQCEFPNCQKQGGWGYERERKVIEWRCYSHRDLEYKSKSS